jgi:hypothetical protein
MVWDMELEEIPEDEQIYSVILPKEIWDRAYRTMESPNENIACNINEVIATLLDANSDAGSIRQLCIDVNGGDASWVDFQKQNDYRRQRRLDPFHQILRDPTLEPELEKVEVSIPDFPSGFGGLLGRMMKNIMDNVIIAMEERENRLYREMPDLTILD